MKFLTDIAEMKKDDEVLKKSVLSLSSEGINKLLHQSYSSDLLKTPCPTFSDNLDVLMDILTYIEHKLWKKLNNNHKKREKCEKIKIEFLELCKKIKIKEINKKNSGLPQKYFYRIKMPTKCSHDLLSRLRFAGFYI